MGSRHLYKSLTPHLCEQRSAAGHEHEDHNHLSTSSLLQVAQRFDCLAVTLEQPFKDTKETPDKEFGWSPQRAQRLGASLLDAILAVVPKLR